MESDPVCGMTVDEATARSAERDGQTFYFCSEHCRRKFLNSESKENPQSAHDHNGHGLKPASAGSVTREIYLPDAPGSAER